MCTVYMMPNILSRNWIKFIPFVSDLEVEIEILQTRKRSLKLEAEQHAEQHRAKTNEIDNLLSQLKHKDDSAHNIISR